MMTQKKSKKKNKKILTAAAAILTLVALLAGTFAWIQSQDDVLNELNTNQYTDNDVVIQEVFTPPDSWDPNMEVVKQVNMVNTGTGRALVRVSMEEILGLLKENGAVTKTSTYNDSAVLTGQADANNNWIPIYVDISAYTAAGSGWTALTNTQIDTSELTVDGYTGAGVTILMKKTGDSYGYFAYRTLSGGGYQKVELGKVNTLLDSSGNFAKVQLLGVDPNATTPDKNIKFHWYEGKNYTYASWAGTKKYVPGTTTALKPALTLTGTPAVTAISTLDGKIMLNFGKEGTNAAVTTNLAAAVDNKCWYYNADDGWFYYMNILEPGNSSVQFLGSLKLAESAGVEYSLMDYKLGIVSQAIQVTKEALSSSSGWNLPAGGLLTALENICDND